MKKVTFAVLLILVCFITIVAQASSLIEVTDYTIPDIDQDAPEEDFFGIWKAKYFCPSGVVYDYDSFIKFMDDSGSVFEYEGNKYSYFEFLKGDYLIIEKGKIFNYSGPIRSEESYSFNESITDESNIFILKDGNLMINVVENDQSFIYEKQTIIQVMDQLYNQSTVTSSSELSLLSYNNLVTLKDKINLALWNSKEWQEITVPQGVWKIGENIPAGYWTIKMQDKHKTSWSAITYCSELDETKMNAAKGKKILYQQLSHPDYDYPAPKQIDIQLQEGNYLIIEQCDMVFTPFAGKPDLGFK